MTNTEYPTLGSVAELIAQTLHISLCSLQRMLNRETHRPLGEITRPPGLPEPGNFARAFKNWIGKTPTEYREDR
jgi:AraC-like DNA-binding protein